MGKSGRPNQTWKGREALKISHGLTSKKGKLVLKRLKKEDLTDMELKIHWLKEKSSAEKQRQELDQDEDGKRFSRRNQANMKRSLRHNPYWVGHV